MTDRSSRRTHLLRGLAGGALAAVLVTACSGSGALLPGTAPDPEPTPPPDDPTVEHELVLINELCPANRSIVSDEAGEFDDWLELFNPGPDPVDLGGWTVGAEDANDPWRLPDGLVIGAGDHLLLWADRSPHQGARHIDMGLDADGDSVALRRPDGSAADTWALDAVPRDLVLGRFPDGGPGRSLSIYATPEGPNPTDPGTSRERSDVLFPTDRLLRFDLYLDEANELLLLQDNHTRVEAELVFQGARFPSVEVLIKGQLGSRRNYDQKAAFRVDLDEFVPGTRLRGQENLTFNNMVQDPTGVAETVTYRLMRDLDIPAPRVAHMQLYINDQYRGLYLNIEPPDDQFLKRWFDDPHGNLYEGEYGIDVIPSRVDQLDHDEQGADAVTDRSDLAALTDLLDDPDLLDDGALAQAVDVERLTRTLAAEVLVGHWDGYYQAANNYRLYHQPSIDQWTLLPWGVDQTFRLDGWEFVPQGRLATACLELPECGPKYRLALWQSAELLSSYTAATWLAELRDRILPAYELDPYREATPGQMVDGINATLGYLATMPDEFIERLFPLGTP